MKNNILCEQSTSTEDYAKSLESILPNATVKSKENSDRFYSFGEGIFSNGFYLGRTTTQNFFQMEIQNSHSIIVSIPIIGQYATKFSSKTFKPCALAGWVAAMKSSRNPLKTAVTLDEKLRAVCTVALWQRTIKLLSLAIFLFKKLTILFLKTWDAGFFILAPHQML